MYIFKVNNKDKKTNEEGYSKLQGRLFMFKHGFSWR